MKRFSIHFNRLKNLVLIYIIFIGLVYVKLVQIKVFTRLIVNEKSICFVDIYRWISSKSTFSSRNYFCSGQPAHSYNFYFQQYDQCIGLYIQSNTTSCFRDSTCPNVSPFICQLSLFSIAKILNHPILFFSSRLIRKLWLLLN